MHESRIGIKYHKQDDQDYKPQPHQKQSIKGLFTFYREQQQMQKQKQLQSNIHINIHKKQMLMLKLKLKKNKSKNNSNNNSKDNSKDKLKSKHKSSNKQLNKKHKINISESQKMIINLSDNHTHTHKSKKKIKHLKTQNNNNNNKKKVLIVTQEQLPQQQDKDKDKDKDKQIIINKKIDIVQNFLKLVKKRKEQKIIPQINKTQKVTRIETVIQDKQKFYHLLYPKTSHYDYQLNKQEQIKNKNNVFGNFKHLKKSKAVIVIDQIFINKSRDSLTKSFNSRNRMYTDHAPFEELESQKKLIDLSVQKNFYSPIISRQNLNLSQAKTKQENPISPPSFVTQNKSAIFGNSKVLNHQLKLPLIKNKKINKDLKKIEEFINQEQKNHIINQLQSSNCSPNKNVMDACNKISQSSRRKLQKATTKRLIKNIEQKQEEKCCVALVNLSKPIQQDHQKKHAWNSKKKLLLKKLGLPT